MRKDRNTFLSDFSASNAAFYPNQFPMNQPMQQASQSSNFYMGPDLPMNNSEIEARLSKIERQIHRLDARISKLENQGNIINNIEDTDINNNMYMI